MSTQINALTVVLAENLREEDVDGLVQAIGHFRGVLEVNPHPAEIVDYIAATRTRAELIEKLWSVLKPQRSS